MESHLTVVMFTTNMALNVQRGEVCMNVVGGVKQLNPFRPRNQALSRTITDHWSVKRHNFAVVILSYDITYLARDVPDAREQMQSDRNVTSF